MPADPAGRTAPSASSTLADTSTSFPDLEPAPVNESMETARSTKLRGRPNITIPHPVVQSTGVTVEGHMATMRSTAPSRREQGVLPEASAGRIAEPATREPNVVHGSPSNSFDSAVDDTLDIPDGHMSEVSSESSAGAGLYESSRREPTSLEDANRPNDQAPKTSLSKPANLPSIHVQQPTRDPSESEEMVPQNFHVPEEPRLFGTSPLRRISVTPDITTAVSDTSKTAPDVPAAGPDVPVAPGPQALPCKRPADYPNRAAPSKSRLMLRRTRNGVAYKPFLKLVLGRSVAKVTKPALRLAAHPTESPSALEDPAPMLL